MLCPHCCFDCTEKGKDMSLDTVKAAVDLFLSYNKSVYYFTIGGGEPTVHPQFREIVKILLDLKDSMFKNFIGINIDVFTNGKNDEESLFLMELVKAKKITCIFSCDKYHEKINPKIKRMFKKLSIDPETATNMILEDKNPSPQKVGRAIFLPESLIYPQYCLGEGIFIDPNGFVFPCACRNIPFGHISEDCIPEWYNKLTHSDQCYKYSEFKRLKLLDNEKKYNESTDSRIEDSCYCT